MALSVALMKSIKVHIAVHLLLHLHLPLLLLLLLNELHQPLRVEKGKTERKSGSTAAEAAIMTSLVTVLMISWSEKKAKHQILRPAAGEKSSHLCHREDREQGQLLGTSRPR